MAPSKKDIIILILAVLAVACAAFLFNLKELEKKARLKHEESLQIEKVMKAKAEKSLSLAEADRDAFKDGLEKKKQQADALDKELADHRSQIESARQRIITLDNNIFDAKDKTKNINLSISEMKNRIANVVKDTLKISEEQNLIDNTTKALEERLAAMKEKAPIEKLPGAEDIRADEKMLQLPDNSMQPRLIGEVLTVNREFQFVVVNLGAKDGVNEADVIDIIRDGKSLGKAKVETVRENITAAAIIDKGTIASMKPGDRALLY